ncbi:hypothetical protein YC2023_049419 [Brassica napus]
MKGLKPFLSTPILQGKTPPTYSFVAGETDLLKFYIYKNGLPSSKPFLLRRRHSFFDAVDVLLSLGLLEI